MTPSETPKPASPSSLSYPEAIWRLRPPFPGQAHSVAFSPDGSLLAAGYSNEHSSLLVCSAFSDPGGSPACTAGFIPPGEDDASSVSSVAFSPDGTYLAASLSNGDVLVWNLSARSISDPPSLIITPEESNVVSDLKFESHVAFSPLGSLLAISYNPYTPDGALALLELDSTNLSRTIPAHYVYVQVFSPDAKLVATGNTNGLVQLWEAASGRLLANLYGHNAGVTGILFSPNGDRLSSLYVDGAIREWAVPSGRRIRSLKHLGSDTNAAAMVSVRGGNLVVVGLASGEILLIDQVALRCATLPVADVPITQLASSPRESLLAVAAADGSVAIVAPSRLSPELFGPCSSMFLDEAG